MYEVRKTFEFSGAHKLTLNYDSKCSNPHGHNWIVTVACRTEKLNQNGMVLDFKHIKDEVAEALDHQDLTNLIEIDGKRMNPTAENIAFWISKKIGETCFEVIVKESEGNVAIWRK